MTILVYDMHTLAADTLYSFPDTATKAYSKTKIQIINQKAVATAGSCLENGQQNSFDEWVTNGLSMDSAPTGLPEDFQAVILTLGPAYAVYVKKDEDAETTTIACYELMARQAFGHEAATHYAHAMLDSGLNAYDAAIKTCEYSLLCAAPVEQITRADLEKFPVNYNGLWTGNPPNNKKLK